MAILRKRQIENLEQMTSEQLESFLDSLPAGQHSMSELMDYVEDELYESECDDTLRHAMRFMMDNKLNFPKITNWLHANGGYCDCKLMEQIAPLWRNKFGDD
ncbi:MAG: DUF2695 domain-containing protein [Acidobacteriota bacterium]